MDSTTSPWYFESKPMELDPFDTHAAWLAMGNPMELDPDPFDTHAAWLAMGYEFTPSGTQYTPQDDTSEEQAVSGEIDTPPQSTEGGFSNTALMKDPLESDLLSSQFTRPMTALLGMSIEEKEPDDMQRTTNNPRTEISAASYVMDSSLGAGTQRVQGMLLCTLPNTIVDVIRYATAGRLHADSRTHQRINLLSCWYLSVTARRQPDCGRDVPR